MHQHLNMPREIVDRIFPFIDELIELHFRFLEQLRYRQMEQKKVETIADILLEQFSGAVLTSTELCPLHINGSISRQFVVPSVYPATQLRHLAFQLFNEHTIKHTG